MKTNQDNFIQKTFVFQHEINKDSQNLEVTLRAETDTIDMNSIIKQWKTQNQFTQDFDFKVYDPEINHYIILPIDKALKKGYIFSPIIMIKYKQVNLLNQPQDDNASITSSKTYSEIKRQRNRERTIREVLEHVKQWRQIHKTLDQHKNKINLQQAAKIVGISKKSLDDYYSQLRLAEEYGFNFQMNIQEKIGVLRTFVKQQRPKGSESIKHQRLPKKLKVLETLGKDFKSKRTMIEEPKMNEQQQVESIIQGKFQPPLAIIPQDEYENRFYNSFNFMLNQPQDPFILIGRKNFQKEEQDNDSWYSYL